MTEAQAVQAQEAAVKLKKASQQMLAYANAVNALFATDFVVTVAGSTETVTIPQATKNKLIDMDKYNALKDDIMDAFNELP